MAQVEKLGAKAVALKLGVGNVHSFDPFLEDVTKALGEFGATRFDFLVNNAGISHHASFQKTTEAKLDQLYSVNLKGVFFSTPKLLPLINDGRPHCDDFNRPNPHRYTGECSICLSKGGH